MLLTYIFVVDSCLVLYSLRAVTMMNCLIIALYTDLQLYYMCILINYYMYYEMRFELTTRGEKTFVLSLISLHNKHSVPNSSFLLLLFFMLHI